MPRETQNSLFTRPGPPLDVNPCRRIQELFSWSLLYVVKTCYSEILVGIAEKVDVAIVEE